MNPQMRRGTPLAAFASFANCTKRTMGSVTLPTHQGIRHARLTLLLICTCLLGLWPLLLWLLWPLLWPWLALCEWLLRLLPLLRGLQRDGSGQGRSSHNDRPAVVGRHTSRSSRCTLGLGCSGVLHVLIQHTDHVFQRVNEWNRFSEQPWCR